MSGAGLRGVAAELPTCGKGSGECSPNLEAKVFLGFTRRRDSHCDVAPNDVEVRISGCEAAPMRELAADPARAGATRTRFHDFVRAMTLVLDGANGDERTILERGTRHVRDLIAHDDWLPLPLATPLAGSYGQYLLYRDPTVRFTVVSFVWDGGARTPIHDHTVWGIIGVLRGAELAERFTCERKRLLSHGEVRLEAGEVDRVSPRIGDVHRVRNAFADRPSISIHVYGADLCQVERHTFCPDTGKADITISKPFDNAEPLLRA